MAEKRTDRLSLLKRKGFRFSVMCRTAAQRTEKRTPVRFTKRANARASRLRGPLQCWKADGALFLAEAEGIPLLRCVPYRCPANGEADSCPLHQAGERTRKSAPWAATVVRKRTGRFSLLKRKGFRFSAVCRTAALQAEKRTALQAEKRTPVRFTKRANARTSRLRGPLQC